MPVRSIDRRAVVLGGQGCAPVADWTPNALGSPLTTVQAREKCSNSFSDGMPQHDHMSKVAGRMITAPELS